MNCSLRVGEFSFIKSMASFLLGGKEKEARRKKGGTPGEKRCRKSLNARAQRERVGRWREPGALAINPRIFGSKFWKFSVSKRKAL